MRRSSLCAWTITAATTALGCSVFEPLLPGGDAEQDWSTGTCEVRTCSTGELQTGEDPWSWSALTCVPEADPDYGPGNGGQEMAKLAQADSCDELVAEVKAILAHTTRQQLQRNLQQALRVHCQACEEGGHYLDAAASDPGSDPDPGDTADDYSETNLQVPGVDEADFVKNDGGYVYVAANGNLTIIDAWPADQAHILAQAPIEGTPKRLYVHADLAIVYSMMGTSIYGSDCTYGYTCAFHGDGVPMKITIFDISNRSNPVVTREIETDGAYLSSRRIGDVVHTVIVSPPLNLPETKLWPSDLARWAPTCGEDTPRRSAKQIAAMFEGLWRENQEHIAGLTLTDIMPSIRDTRWQDGHPTQAQTQIGSCENAYLSQTRDGMDLLTVASLDVTKTEELALSTVLGKPGAVYASADSLYIAQPHLFGEGYGWYYGNDTPHATTVHKFRLTAGSTHTEYAGSGVVKGRVINQFAMDEKDGYLRMATTTGWAWASDTHSTVMTLEEKEGQLVVAGAVDNLAPTEDIRSVRFRGDVGYVVTFKKTDPLFVIDLSDPVHPTLRGELHIPGFSTYMHPLGTDHLLSIGYDADDQGSFAWFQGIMLQVMDVSDLDAPALLHKEVIGTRGTTSDAATNHLAFNYFAERELLAVPMVICEGAEGGGTYGDHVSFEGLLVYHVDLESGFSLLGGVPHAEPYDIESWDGCASWWTEASSPVKRSVFMEDWVYSIAMNRIRVAPLADLSNPAVSIDL